jgi:hypothetical protein
MRHMVVRRLQGPTLRGRLQTTSVQFSSGRGSRVGAKWVGIGHVWRHRRAMISNLGVEVWFQGRPDVMSYQDATARCLREVRRERGRKDGMRL